MKPIVSLPCFPPCSFPKVPVNDLGEGIKTKDKAGVSTPDVPATSTLM